MTFLRCMAIWLLLLSNSSAAEGSACENNFAAPGVDVTSAVRNHLHVSEGALEMIRSDPDWYAQFAAASRALEFIEQISSDNWDWLLAQLNDPSFSEPRSRLHPLILIKGLFSLDAFQVTERMRAPRARLAREFLARSGWNDARDPLVETLILEHLLTYLPVSERLFALTTNDLKVSFDRFLREHPQYNTGTIFDDLFNARIVHFVDPKITNVMFRKKAKRDHVFNSYARLVAILKNTGRFEPGPLNKKFFRSTVPKVVKLGLLRAGVITWHFYADLILSTINLETLQLDHSPLAIAQEFRVALIKEIQFHITTATAMIPPKPLVIPTTPFQAERLPEVINNGAPNIPPVPKTRNSSSEENDAQVITQEPPPPANSDFSERIAAMSEEDIAAYLQGFCVDATAERNLEEFLATTEHNVDRLLSVLMRAENEESRIRAIPHVKPTTQHAVYQINFKDKWRAYVAYVDGPVLLRLGVAKGSFTEQNRLITAAKKALQDYEDSR